MFRTIFEFPLFHSSFFEYNKLSEHPGRTIKMARRFPFFKMNKQFQEIEDEFNRLKRIYRQRKISEREYKDRLKALRIRDIQGKCWTIGARTGKWYFFDGKNWVESKPPSQKDYKAVCIYCGYENSLETEECAYCGGAMNDMESSGVAENSDRVPHVEMKESSSSLEAPVPNEGEDEPDAPDGYNTVLKSVGLLSVLWMMGGLGLAIGLVLGVFAGITDVFDPFVKTLPLFLQQRQGNLIGGIVFGILGGAAGFIFLGLLGFIQAVLTNFILSFTGGIKITLEKMK